MLKIAQIIQIVISVLLTLLVLVQSKGKGLSGTLTSSFGAYSVRRGLEKVVFIAAIVLGVLLVANSLLIIYLN